jgi:hypothetical protein
MAACIFSVGSGVQRICTSPSVTMFDPSVIPEN